MAGFRRALLIAGIGLALTACAPMGTLAPGETPPPPAAVVRTEVPPHFVTFVGRKMPHAPPFLDVADTNFFCLRSLVDRATGQTEHQLYVSDSYAGPERGWDRARDGNGNVLRFVAISRDDIGCPDGTCFAEDFAADIPEPELRQGRGLTVTFSAKSGDEKTIVIGADQAALQLAAVDGWRQAAAAAAPH